MGELDHLNEVLIKINENFKDLNVSLLKSLNGEYFLKVETAELDLSLLYTNNIYVIITYSSEQDSLIIRSLSYRAEILFSSSLRFHHRDTDTGLATYLLLLRKLLLETEYKICSGRKEETVFSNFQQIKSEELIKCLIERSPLSTQRIFRSGKCQGVYPVNQLKGESGQCTECMHFFSTLVESKEEKIPELLRCPYLNCSRVFRRPNAFKNHVRTHSTQQPRVDTPPHVDDYDDDDDEDVDDPLPGDLLVKSEPSPQSSNSENGEELTETQESESMEKQEEESTMIEDFSRKKSKESGGKKRISKKRILLQSIEDKIKDLQCSHCQTDFSSKRTLMKHLKAVHTDVHRCEKCDKSYPFKEELENHMITVHEPVTCSDCGDEFANQNSLSTHQSVVHRSTLEPCYMCGKWMKKSSVSAHIRMVHKGDEQRTHLCNICGKSYKTKTDLDRHYTKHTGQKKYYCSVCGLGYRFWGGADDCQR
ncbi:zinc finger protein 567, partial [Eurytemora carolleeae]|uniref:zinc finger protein 567 n=1 Tax=Eurytemora carolleeae TaxID=1294199 RepID=UPI000C77BEC5